MATTIPDAKSEEILDIWTAVDIYVMLHTADPGKTGANEGTGISRVLITSATDWAAAVAHGGTGGRLQDNSVLIDFGTSSAAETYTHFGFWTAVSGGTFLGGASLTSSVAVAIGEGVRFPIGDLDMIAYGDS